MGNVQEGFAKGKTVYVGIDVHKKDWSVHVMCAGELIYEGTQEAQAERLIRLLKRLGAKEVHTVYEAGGTGFGLHDALVVAGFDSMVTPPSLVPQVGGRVKTDRRDGRKLAMMLAGGFLKRVFVLSPEERAHRQLLRTRNQMERHRKSIQLQIKSLLLFHGQRVPLGMREHWSRAYVEWIRSLQWDYRELQASVDALLKAYEHLDQQYRELTKAVESLGQTERYHERSKLLQQIPGIGALTAMAILLELQDVERFRHADQLASYLGLTPSQHSTGQRIRVGSITRCGNRYLRSRFVESSWTLIRYDSQARATYERIKQQTGSGKKAIVGIARRLALRVRRVLLDGPTQANLSESVKRYKLV